MPKAGVKKTGWVLSFRAQAATALIVVATLALGYMVVSTKHAGLKLGGKKFIYETAETALAREKGLSGRDSMARDHAMLFVFREDGEHCFWMKDTRFPLDMVWLDGDKKIVYIKMDVQPSSYPDSICPNQPSRYVVEINAGQSAELNLSVGDKASF